MDGPKALGLSPSSEQLFDILPDITKLQTSDATHSAKIATNTAGIAGIQTNVESIQTNADDIKALVSFHKHKTYALSFYKSQKVLCRSKFFEPAQTFDCI